MKKIILLILLLLSAFSLNAEPKWKLVKFLNTNNKVYDHDIHTIESIDSSYCLALGVFELDPKLYLTTDKGRNWELIFNGNSSWETKDECISMAYPHKDHIFLGYANATIHHSRDRGKTWDTNKVVLPDTSRANNNLRIDNLAMADTLNGMAIAMILQVPTGKKGGKFLLITNDAWKTIRIINQSEIPGLWSFEYPCPINKDTMMLFGTGKEGMVTVHTTYNGAKSWASVDTLKGVLTIGRWDAKPVCKSPDGSYWLAGKRSNGIGDQSIDIMYKLDKLGGTWSKVYEKELATPWGLQEIAFGDALNGVAVGADGKVLRTNDGGKTWKQDTLIDERNRIARAPVMNVTYCGSTPIIGDRTGRIWILEDNASVVTEEIISKLNLFFPNPAGDYLNIRDIEKVSGDIEIYSLTGEKLLQCNSTAKIDIRTLPAGIYYAKVNNQFNKFIKK